MSVFKSSFHTGFRLQRTYVRAFSSVVDLPITPVSGPPPPPQSRTSKGNAVQDALTAADVRHNWTREEISEIYNTSLFELQYAAVRIFHLSEEYCLYRVTRDTSCRHGITKWYTISATQYLRIIMVL